MGLNAFVNCNCLREGRVKDLPFSLERLYIDEDGYLILCGRDENDLEVDILLDRWQQEACGHPDFKYVSVRIANWGGYRHFQDALARAGWEHFPVLHAELPETNGGCMSPEAAAQALRELDYFRQCGPLGTSLHLINTETGESIHEAVVQYGGEFMWGPDIGMRLFDGEFQIIDRVFGDRIAFRARRFTQTLLDDNPSTRNGREYVGQVRYRDLDRDISYTTRVGVSKTTDLANGEIHFEYPASLHVEQRQVMPADFEYIVKPLYTVFRAAVEIGNPVHWT
ncbi:MAG: hypothetical protein ACYDCO_17770 [Armatimonadota bacterium]